MLLPNDSVATRNFTFSDYAEGVVTTGAVAPISASSEALSPPSLPISSNLPLNSTSFRINPYETRKWNDRDEREFTDLAFRVASYEADQDEQMKFRQMVAARRRDIPQRSAEQIMLTAEHDQLLSEMRDVLQKYHAFRVKLGPHFKGNHAFQDSPEV